MKESNESDSSFCVLPWIGLEIRPDGKKSFCCIAQKTFRDPSELKAIKKALLEGRKPQSCKACWRIEKAGMVSRRQKLNKIHHQKALKIQKNPEEPKNQNRLILDLKLGNICNQKCLICGPTSSSLWIEEYKALYQKKFEVTPFERQRILEAQPLIDEAKEVHISGGEPFLKNSGLESLLSYAVTSGKSKNQKWIITTNGSFYLDVWIEKYFPKFKTVSVLLSADGVGGQFEYLRYPGKWETFFENYLCFKKTDYFSGICITLSALNAFNLCDTLKFWDDLDETAIFVNFLDQPQVLAPLSLPFELRVSICQHWLGYSFKNHQFHRLVLELIQYMSQSSVKSVNDQSLRDFLDKHDRFRKTTFKENFKEYDSILRRRWNS